MEHGEWKDLHELAGNWRKFDSFAWFDKPEDAEKWAIVYTHNRDSDLLTESNAAAIDKVMSKEEYAEDVHKESHGHWACGWVEGYAIRVFDADGRPTLAILAWLDLQAKLDDYPVLDEEDWSERESEACAQNFEEAVASFARSHDIEMGKDDWQEVMRVNAYIEQNGEGRDGGGYYPHDDEIEDAINELWPWAMEDGTTEPNRFKRLVFKARRKVESILFILTYSYRRWNINRMYRKLREKMNH